MRLLHVGDIHLHDGPHLDDTLQALDQVHRIAMERAVDLILIPGDIYDRKSSPHERALMSEWLDSLQPIPVMIARGNHDAQEDLLPLALAGHVAVYEYPALRSVGPIDVLCLPWPERAHLAASGLTGEGGLQAAQAVLGNLVRAMAANRDTSRPLVIMGHLSVVGALTSSGQPLVGREIQIVAEDLAETGAAYVALGHIHKAQEIAPRVVYAGSLTIRDFGEEGEEKCVVLVGLAGEDLVESIPIKCRDWVTIDAGPSPEGLPPWEAVRGLLPEPEIIDALVPGANVRYRYACDEASVSRFDHAEIARRFADAHTLKIVPQITRSARVRAADVAAARSLADKLRAWGQVTGTEIYDRLLDRLDQLEEEVSHGS